MLFDFFYTTCYSLGPNESEMYCFIQISKTFRSLAMLSFKAGQQLQTDLRCLPETAISKKNATKRDKTFKHKRPGLGFNLVCRKLNVWAALKSKK